MLHNGKEVWTENNFDYSTVKIGDYVEQAVVDNAMDCLPPACMRSDCAQMGEPYSHREDPVTGQWRAVYATFKRVTPGYEGIWQYCGHCFRGENVERGKDPAYVKAYSRETAKEVINEYVMAEFGEDQLPDYSNPAQVGVAFTTLEEDEYHEIQAYVNLVDFRIETLVDGNVIRAEQFASLEDLIEQGLRFLAFDDLVYVSEEELEQIEKGDF